MAPLPSQASAARFKAQNLFTDHYGSYDLAVIIGGCAGSWPASPSCDFCGSGYETQYKGW